MPLANRIDSSAHFLVLFLNIHHFFPFFAPLAAALLPLAAGALSASSFSFAFLSASIFSFFFLMIYSFCLIVSASIFTVVWQNPQQYLSQCLAMKSPGPQVGQVFLKQVTVSFSIPYNLSVCIFSFLWICFPFFFVVQTFFFFFFFPPLRSPSTKILDPSARVEVDLRMQPEAMRFCLRSAIAPLCKSISLTCSKGIWSLMARHRWVPSSR